MGGPEGGAQLGRWLLFLVAFFWSGAHRLCGVGRLAGILVPRGVGLPPDVCVTDWRWRLHARLGVERRFVGNPIGAAALLGQVLGPRGLGAYRPPLERPPQALAAAHLSPCSPSRSAAALLACDPNSFNLRKLRNLRIRRLPSCRRV